MDLYKDSAAQTTDRPSTPVGSGDAPCASRSVAAEPTWQMVEDYFDGPECFKCPYLRGHGNGRYVYCGLARPWKGLGRAPEPSDCRGVVRQLEDAE